MNSYEQTWEVFPVVWPVVKSDKKNFIDLIKRNLNVCHWLKNEKLEQKDK